jgi:putative redox protein
VSKAVSLSADKYCSASRMLEKAATITHDFEIVNLD